MGRDQYSSTAGGTGGADVKDVAEAHRQLLQDKQLQFDFTQIKLPDPPQWPEWVIAVLKVIAPILGYLFWGVIILAVLLILFLIVREIITVRFGGREKPSVLQGPNEMDWRPTAARARVLLADADALAAQGRYAEAAHLLLLHGVQDIRDQRPGLVQPALTSRDISALSELPAQARAAFGAIAAVVERSFFGGRDLGADDWTGCRKAYEDFALGGAAR